MDSTQTADSDFVDFGHLIEHMRLSWQPVVAASTSLPLKRSYESHRELENIVKASMKAIRTDYCAMSRYLHKTFGRYRDPKEPMETRQAAYDTFMSTIDDRIAPRYNLEAIAKTTLDGVYSVQDRDRFVSLLETASKGQRELLMTSHNCFCVAEKAFNALSETHSTCLASGGQPTVDLLLRALEAQLSLDIACAVPTLLQHVIRRAMPRSEMYQGAGSQ